MDINGRLAQVESKLDLVLKMLTNHLEHHHKYTIVLVTAVLVLIIRLVMGG